MNSAPIGLDGGRTADRQPLSRVSIFAMLALALLVGGWLRFESLGEREMSADEGASWAAAAAPNVPEVIRLQAIFNPGKLAVHELALHQWTAVFGEGLAAMRAMSALLGTLAIAMVFVVARELFAPVEEAGLDADEIGAASALLFAVNLITIKYSREARMYPILMLATLAQVWFFIRAERRARLLDCAALALLTSLILATHFTAAFVLATEALWLISRVRSSMRTDAELRHLLRKPITVGVSLIAGILILAPWLPAAIGASGDAVTSGAIDWIERPPLWEPLALFNKATGSLAFPVLAALAAWGVASAWRRAQEPIAFALWWMWGPIAIAMIVSYAVKPVLLERYALSCFVPFFVLAALGIWEAPRFWWLRSLDGQRQRAWRAGLGALAILLSLGHIAAYYRKPHDAQWREATAAASRLAAGGMIAVAPAYADNVVRYYVAPTERGRVLATTSPPEGPSPGAGALILGDQGLPQARRASLMMRFPTIAARLRGVEVRVP